MEISKTQQLVDEVMDFFNFSKVHKTMKLLEWRVLTKEGMMVPDETDLRRDARQMIYDLINTVENSKDDDVWYSHCGPFKVRISKDEGEINSITLDFVVTEWEAYLDEE